MLTSGNVTAPTPVAADVDDAAEKGVRAALATGSGAVEEVVHDSDIAAIQAHLDAVKRTGQPQTLAISDIAHVEPSESPANGSAEPTTATDAEKSATKGKEKAAENQEEKSVGEGKSVKNGKEKEKERKGHGIRHDSSGDGQGWVGEIKLVSASRYIGKSRDKMELAYLHSIAYIVYDGYVSKVLIDELTVLEKIELEKWRKVWEEVRILPTGMWTVIWARGAYLPKTRFDNILDKYRVYKSSGDALHDALLPAIWFPINDDTKEGKEKSSAMMSDMIAASAFAVWCFVETDSSSVLDAVGEGKAAAMVAGASEKTADVFKTVMQSVLEVEIEREPFEGEVAHNVAPALQSQALERAFKEGVVGVEADVIARATIETMAF
ncbi:unnamed protein product [Closterium sp. Naga37s-1]|nr:unnamed protein product [Closterium sp. Naga37s-1]